jgi:multicomponent Na+:H+ antiporter subunit D
MDALSQPIIIFINAILLFFLIFGKEIINITFTDYIDKKREHIFYSILLFAHIGYLGVISTNDLFNLYVFIEISSLATYVLMSTGKNPSALVGAFNYLVMGTIGATLILISIGILLAITGSLNVNDIAQILSRQYGSRLLITAIVFFLTGAMLKMAFFPMHFWMIKSYSSVAPFILTYLASIASVIGVYIILRFMHFTIEVESIYTPFSSVVKPLSLVTIIICTFLAFRENNIKKIIIYSTASQIGYIFLLITITHAKGLLFQLLMMDALNKIALFTMIAHLQIKTDILNLELFPTIENSMLFKILVAFSLVFSAGLPITGMFMVKIHIIELLINHNFIITLAIVVMGSVFGLLYHFKLVSAVFFASRENGAIRIETGLYGFVAIVIAQFAALFYMNELAEIAGYTESVILQAT